MTSTIVTGTIHRHRRVSLIRTDTFTSACSTAICITPISTTDMVIRRDVAAARVARDGSRRGARRAVDRRDHHALVPTAALAPARGDSSSRLSCSSWWCCWPWLSFSFPPTGTELDGRMTNG